MNKTVKYTIVNRVLLILAFLLLSGCVEPILLANCAIEKPLTPLTNKTRYYEAKMVFTGKLGEHESKTTIQCNIVDYSCHAGAMGLAPVWETIPLDKTTLSAPMDEQSTFKIETPGCYGLLNSYKDYQAGRESYSYWSKPRIETVSKITKIPIWYQKHRDKFSAVGIKRLELTVVQINNPAHNK